MEFILGVFTGALSLLLALRLSPKPEFTIKHIPLMDNEGKIISKIEVDTPQNPFLLLQAQGEYKVYSYIEGEEVKREYGETSIF